MESKYQKYLKKYNTFLVYIFCCFLFLLLAFEGIYHRQIIDTYAPELAAFNPVEDVSDDKDKKTILVLGDSFTAAPNSYSHFLQNRLTDYKIINSGVSGTGVIQASIIAPGRFKKFNPDIFIYQIYVGNDLFDITYPVNWKTLSIFRNTFWTASNYFRSISFLNYRLGQIKASKRYKNEKGKREMLSIDTTENFAVEKYNNREKLYIKAEPAILENQIMVKGSRKKDFEKFLTELEKLVSHCEKGKCEAYLLVIPHACQVDKHYLKNMEQIGSEFDEPDLILRDEYPFITKIAHNFKKDINVHVLNPIQFLRDMEDDNKLMYYQNDGHLNTQGQEALAEFIIDQINLN